MEFQELKRKVKDTGHLNGISFDCLTVYRIELIHLKDEGYSDKSIAERLSIISNSDVSQEVVNKWFVRQTQPKEHIISALETLFKFRYNSARSA